ncbi:PHD finger protein rhinoceros-like [Palaemon carinicauda]|uniref:PHD finger protein rhinoceros-like n=1 Tax=Palaemon carinicauda TaxID=392227 RepID=UPI0035B64AE6
MDDNHGSIDICKGQEIVVQVEEAQRDLILVTYNHGTQVFQGVLLDSTKGQLPCGIYPPGGEFPPKPPPDLSAGDNEDKLYSVKQRHTYFQQDGTLQEPNSKDKKGIQLRKSISLTQRFKNSRMTVRLRPRQVLCSKCQSICNEKSENVSGAKGQRATEPPTAAKSTAENSRGNTRSARDKNNQDQQESNSSHSRRSERSPQKSVMLVPKLVKLKPSEIEAATNRRSPSTRGTRSDSDSCDNELNLGLIPNPAYSVLENNNSSEGKVPKLKLSTNICTASESQEGKKKGRIPKMTISTLAISPPRHEASKDSDKVNDAKSLSIPKMILSTTGIVSEYVSDKKDKENTKIRKESGDSRTDAKELRLRSGNIHKLTITAAGQGYSESLSDRLSPIPKLTILPVVQKKEVQEDKEAAEIKHSKIVKSHSEEIPSEKMSLRKKRSLGSMEDLWDESVFDETAKKHRREDSEEEKEDDAVKSVSEEKECLEGEKPKSTPVLKISFGPEGKGTVLKIPSKSTVVSLSTPEVETEEEISKKSKDMSAKAARKALKKAKKEAQRKAMMGNASPASVMGGMSPRFGGMSPLRLGGVSPARLGGFSPARFGGTSPARFGGMSPARAAAVDLSTRDLPTKKHKHKVKHKKKHKDERRHKFQDETKIQVDIKSDSKDLSCPPDSTDADIPVENITPDDAWNASEAREGAVDLTNPNLARQLPNSKVVAQPSTTLQQSRHKLSISIKRVSNASYVACDSSHSDGERTVTPTSNSALDEKEKSPVLKCTAENTVLERTKDKLDVHECSKNVLPDTSSFQELEEDKKYLSVVEGPENYSNDNFSANTYRMETPEPSLPGSDSPGSDDPCNGAIPDFPSRAPSIEEMSHTSASLLMKLSWQEVNHCNVSDGRIMKIGDVVWGKIHGFPWWPAKVIAIRILREVNGETKWQQAHVSWYGSSTQSLMPADTLQPFLQMFKVRYNKRKRGPYREAIKQATCEAEQTSVDPLMSLHLDHHQGHLPLQHQSQVQLRTSTQVMNQKYLKPLQLNQQYVGNPPQQISPPIQPHSAPVSQQPHQLQHQQPPVQQQQPQQQQQQQQQQQKTPDNLPVLSASPREVDVVS